MDAGLLDLAVALHLQASPEFQRVEDVRPAVDIRQHLNPKQLEAFNCEAPAFNVLGGRQGGKTFELGAWLFEGGFSKPGSLNVYFALTSKSARHIMWVEIKILAALLGLDPSCLNEHTMTVTLPNGSRILCTGTDDTRTIETWRGVKLNRVGIDEMGAQPAQFIEYFVAMIWPTLIKNRGRMQRTGNPGRILSGYWYDQTGPDRQVDVPLFHWTAWDNPALGTPDEVDSFVDAALADSGVTRDSVTFKVEWLAQWTKDLSVLVYPFDLERNSVDALPLATRHGRPIDPTRWRYVITIDPAGVGTTGLSVMAAHPDIIGAYVLRSLSLEGAGIDLIVSTTRSWIFEFPRAQVVMDTGGLGSVHAQEFARKYAIPVIPAKKTERKSAVRFTHDGFESGRVKVLAGPQNDAVREGCAKIGWNEDKTDHADGSDDHVLDTVVYGDRHLHDYAIEEKKPGPPPNTREWYEQQEDAMADRLARRLKRPDRGGRPSWDAR